MTDCPSEPRVTELEIRLAHQDQLLRTLDQVVVELRAELAEAGERIQRLEQQLTAGMPEDAVEAPPPHY